MPKNLGLYDNNLSIPRKQDVDLISNELEQLTQDFDEHIGNFNNPHEVSKEQIGLNNVENILQYSANNPPPYPVTSVNGATGVVNLTAESIGALPAQIGAAGQFLGFTAANVVGAVDAPSGGGSVESGSVVATTTTEDYFSFPVQGSPKFAILVASSPSKPFYDSAGNTAQILFVIQGGVNATNIFCSGSGFSVLSQSDAIAGFDSAAGLYIYKAVDQKYGIGNFTGFTYIYI